MDKLTLYGLAKCSTCHKAMAWLDGQGADYRFIDYRDHPIEPDALRDYAAQVGGWPKLVNRASMTWRNLPESRKDPGSDDDWLALIAEYPALVRRPLAVHPNGTVSVGFSEKKYADLFA